MTMGKVLGLIAFSVSELLVFFGCAVILMTLDGLDYSFFAGLLGFQGTIMVTVWGSKASSNFAKKRFESNRDVGDMQ